MYNYTNEPTKSLLIELQATKNAIKFGTLRGQWLRGAKATVHHIQDELNSRENNH